MRINSKTWKIAPYEVKTWQLKLVTELQEYNQREQLLFLGNLSFITQELPQAGFIFTESLTLFTVQCDQPITQEFVLYTPEKRRGFLGLGHTSQDGAAFRSEALDKINARIAQTEQIPLLTINFVNEPRTNPGIATCGILIGYASCQILPLVTTASKPNLVADDVSEKA